MPFHLCQWYPQRNRSVHQPTTFKGILLCLIFQHFNQVLLLLVPWNHRQSMLQELLVLTRCLRRRPSRCLRRRAPHVMTRHPLQRASKYLHRRSPFQRSQPKCHPNDPATSPVCQPPLGVLMRCLHWTSSLVVVAWQTITRETKSFGMKRGSLGLSTKLAQERIRGVFHW